MARVPYVQPQDASPELREVYASTERMNGRLPNFHRIFGHVPETYRWYQGLQFSLQRDTSASSLSPQLRQLAHLATSEVNRCRYCATHNSALAIKRGIAPEKVAWLNEHVDEDPDQELFDERERLVIRWAKAVTRNEARRDMALFAELETIFTPTQIVELTVVVAARTFTNLIQEALWTDLEEPVADDGDHDQPAPALTDARELLKRHAELVAEQLRAPAPVPHVHEAEVRP